MSSAQDTSSIQNIRPNVYVHRVYEETSGRTNEDGTPQMHWMVEYSPGTERHLARICAPWDEMQPDERGADPHSAIGKMALERYLSIKPYVEAAQKGTEVPLMGHALKNWPAIDHRRLEIMTMFGVRTVEELVSAPESTLIKINSHMPDVRHYARLGRQFIEAQDAARAAAELERRDKVIESQGSIIEQLKSDMGELRSMLEQLATAALAGPPPDGSRRRGAQ